MKDYARAVADFDQAFRLDPSDPDALYWRGMAKRQNGDKAGGAADIATARRMNPNAGR
jgi:Flp pilus assembly protein TadD